MADVAFDGVAGQAELVRRGEVSSRELVEGALARIERLDRELNSFAAVYAERALADADRADAQRMLNEANPPLNEAPAPTFHQAQKTVATT